jgi:glycosyltransferase involved in cell wall biosynthesis
MTMPSLTYSVVTTAMNEADNLGRLMDSLERQSLPPEAWLIVDTGSTDDTRLRTSELEKRHGWIKALQLEQPYGRGGPIVRAFQAGVEALPSRADVIVKIDADVSFDASYFEELMRRFEADPVLGLASGTCLEERDGRWRPRHVTGDHVWGACRAYRAGCFADVTPLEERMGWDGIDAFKASVRGWRTSSFRDLTFRHHRPEGARDRRLDAWLAHGRAAHYMGYRPTFLLLRSLFRAREDPVALAMVGGFAAAAIRREPQVPDANARAVVRRQQRLREVPLRALEALGWRRSPILLPVLEVLQTATVAVVG